VEKTQMNRDAKIGIVVILITVGFLLIIWARSERTEEPALPPEPESSSSLGMPPASTEFRTDSAGDALDGGARVVSVDRLPLPPDATTTTAPTTTTTTTTPPDTTATTEPQPEPQPTYWTYTVQARDRLEAIARQHLGDGKRWREIAELNHIADPTRIQVGQKLKMPPKTATTTAVREPSPKETDTTTTTTTTGARRYVVKKGDVGLMQIARDQLGDVRRWREIAELNGLDKNDIIRVGQVLQMPQ
jgi:nucleoid-associated protein YgaU